MIPSLSDIFWSILLPSIAGGGTGILTVVYLSKKLLEQQLSKDIERYKSELKEKTEVLKTGLSIYTHEQNVSLSRIDAQRAEAVAKIYSALRSWINPATMILNGCSVECASEEMHVLYFKQYTKLAYVASKDLGKEVADHAIYFDEDDYKLLIELTESCLNCVSPFLRLIEEGEELGYNSAIIASALESGMERFRSSAGVILSSYTEQLVCRFRKILGSSRAVNHLKPMKS